MKKIVIFYLFDHTGHHRACQALERAFAMTSDDVEIRVVHSLRCFSPRAARWTESAYLWLLKRAPFLWGLVYDRPGFLAALEGVVLPWMAPAFKKVMDELRPDAVVCTQALPAILVADYKRREKSGLPVFAVLTDFHPHSYWPRTGITSYIVPSEEAVRTFERRGVESRKILRIGIPVDPAFRPAGSEAPHSVLIMGGSHGFLPVEELLRQLRGLSGPFPITVITGRNERLRRLVEKAAAACPGLVSVYGYVPDVHRHLQAARLFITKGGGLSLAEAMACGVPTVLLKCLPGQEDHNARALSGMPNIYIAENARHAARLAGEVLRAPAAPPKADPPLAEKRGEEPPAEANSALRITRFIRESVAAA